MAPKGWTKVVDDHTQVQFESDGGGFVVANKRSNGEWSIVARGELGRRDLGTRPSKSAATARMKEYMRANNPGSFGLSSASGGSGDGADDPLDFEPDVDGLGAEDDDLGLL